jgi:hypothetical protein
MMQDRPAIPELLESVTKLLNEEIIPNLTGSHQFYGRVAANVLRTVIRELEAEETQLTAEWERLNSLLPHAAQPTMRAALKQAIHQRTEDLCQRIHQGDADAGPYREQVLAHIRESVREKLVVNNPGWIQRPAS